MKRHPFTLLLTAFILLTGAFTLPGSTQTKEEKIDALFSKWDKPGSPGAAIAVVKDGKTLYTKGYGYANLEYDIPITPKTVFDIASVSKQFTGMAIAMLEEQGKISMDDDIRKHIPEVPDFGKTITLRHLNHHTSGIRDWPAAFVIAGWNFDDIIEFDHILKLVQHMEKLIFDPGEKHLYSNTNYNLLAEVVKRVTGKSLREWTGEHMFKPLGMNNTHFHDNHHEIVKNRAYSYYFRDNEYIKAVENLTAFGSSSLYTTVEDLTKWMINLGAQKVGGKTVIEKMYSTGLLNNGEKVSYAYGLGSGEYKGLKTFSHSGSWGAFVTYLLYFPDQEFGVTVLFNRYSSAGRMAREIADIYLEDLLKQEKEEKPKQKSKPGPKPKQTPKPAERKAIKIKPGLFDRYVGNYRLYAGFVLTISREGNKFMGQATGQKNYQILPQSKTKFYFKDFDAQILFQENEKGNIAGLTLIQNGRERVAKRFEAVNPEPGALKIYTGSYYCSELDARYVVIMKDNRLTVTHRRHRDATLRPEEKDRFMGSGVFTSVLFKRDEQGNISGFTLGSPRAGDFYFKKIL
jgi:CubicO group peptidase (beta-lactamase class C family)